MWSDLKEGEGGGARKCSIFYYFLISQVLETFNHERSRVRPLRGTKTGKITGQEHDSKQPPGTTDNPSWHSFRVRACTCRKQNKWKEKMLSFLYHRLKSNSDGRIAAGSNKRPSTPVKYTLYAQYSCYCELNAYCCFYRQLVQRIEVYYCLFLLTRRRHRHKSLQTL